MSLAGLVPDILTNGIALRARPPRPKQGEKVGDAMSTDYVAKRCGDGGWLFRLREPSDQFARNKRAWTCVSKVGGSEASRLDLAARYTQYRAALEPSDLTKLADQLGLSAGNLLRLGLGWCGWEWTFPM